MSLHSIITEIKNNPKFDKKILQNVKLPSTQDDDSDSDEVEDKPPNKKQYKMQDKNENNDKKLEQKLEQDKTDDDIPFIPFWSENPNILTDFRYILEFFPTEVMTYEQKLNAVTRTILILTLLGFIYSKSVRLLFISVITIFALFLMHHYHKKEKAKHDNKKAKEEVTEGFENPAIDVLNNKNIAMNPAMFVPPSSQNPLSNVLMSEYEYNPNRKPAPPAFNSAINDDILAQTKNMINEVHPDQPDITDRLFKDLGEEMQFEQSMRQFHSNPSTTIPNDQGAFAEFCYGSMISCKEGNLFACARNKSNYTNY